MKAEVYRLAQMEQRQGALCDIERIEDSKCARPMFRIKNLTNNCPTALIARIFDKDRFTPEIAHWLRLVYIANPRLIPIKVCESIEKFAPRPLLRRHTKHPEIMVRVH